MTIHRFIFYCEELDELIVVYPINKSSESISLTIGPGVPMDENILHNWRWVFVGFL